MIRYAASPQVQQLIAELERWAASGSSALRISRVEPPDPKVYGTADLGFYNTLQAIRLSFIYFQIQHASLLLQGAYTGLWQDSFEGLWITDYANGGQYLQPPQSVPAGSPAPARPVPGWDYGSGPDPDYVAQLQQYRVDQAAAAAAAAAYLAANPPPVTTFTSGDAP